MIRTYFKRILRPILVQVYTSLYWVGKYLFYRLSIPNDWVIAVSILSTLISSKNGSKKILGIMDFNQHHWALGDTVTFHETLLVLRDTYNCKLIDLCIFEELHNKVTQHKKNLVFL